MYCNIFFPNSVLKILWIMQRSPTICCSSPDASRFPPPAAGSASPVTLLEGRRVMRRGNTVGAAEAGSRCRKSTFSNSSQAISPICTKLYAQHLWTFLTKSFFFKMLIFQTILRLLNNNFLYILLKTRSVWYLHIGLSEWHETRWLLPHEPHE